MRLKLTTNFLVCFITPSFNRTIISIQQPFTPLPCTTFYSIFPFIYYFLRRNLFSFTASTIEFTIQDALFLNPFRRSHLGLSGTLFLIIIRANIPTHPSKNITLQFYQSTARVRREAIVPPRCQVPSMPILTLPLKLGGINQSIPVKMAVNQPPTLSPVTNLAITKITGWTSIPEKRTPKKQSPRVILIKKIIPKIFSFYPVRMQEDQIANFLPFPLSDMLKLKIQTHSHRTVLQFEAYIAILESLNIHRRSTPDPEITSRKYATLKEAVSQAFRGCNLIGDLKTLLSMYSQQQCQLLRSCSYRKGSYDQYLIMIRTCTKLLRQGLKVPRVDLTPRQLKKNLKIDFWPVVGIKERKMGACIFNQPNNQNMLTQEFLEELYRFLLSYQYDNTVENVFIQSKHSVFCHGVDYKQLSQDKTYLDQLSQLAILFAKFNKPLFGQISGGVKGAGVYLLSMMTMPWGYSDAFLKCDQCSRGMIPLMGGTHRLARLPLRLGYYLALVGDELNWQEMAQLGFLKGYIHDDVSNEEIRKKFHESNMSFREKYRYMDFDEQDSLLEGQQKIKVEQNKNRYESEMEYYQSEMLSSKSKNLNLRFAVNQRLAADVDFQNVVHPFNSFSEETSGRTINNYYQMRFQRPLKYLQEHQLVSSFDIKRVELKRLNPARIDHIFGKSSISQILQALKEERAEWAQRAYKKMKQADPLALQLTLQLLQRAEKQSWIQCLETQFIVARRLLRESYLELRTYEKSSSFTFTNQYSAQEVGTIPRSKIDEFFLKAQKDDKLEHQIADNALLPACDYFEVVPDSARAYLNRQQFVDKHYSEQVPQIIRYLNLNHINYKSKVYDVDVLRRHVYQKLQIDMQKQRLKKRLDYMASHQQTLHHYHHSRVQHLSQVQTNDLESIIDSSLKNIFKEKFQKRFDSFETKTAHLIGHQNKINLFKRVKDIILNNILFKGYEMQKAKKGKNQYNGLIYFDNKGKNVITSTNIHLRQDKALSCLSGIIRKGQDLASNFKQHQNKQMPKYYAMNKFMTDTEKKDKIMYQKIKYLYDQKPELWAEAYTYREMVLQASKTSQDLSGYLEWTFQNFYDLLDYSDRLYPTYGQFAADMTKEVIKSRQQKIQKLKNLSMAREQFLNKSLFSRLYTFKNQQKMRSIFPYFFQQKIIPKEFRRNFLSTLDSTLEQFTSAHRQHQKLLIKQELGILDKWINREIAQQYTQFLQQDVQYVTSYLQILFVKEMLMDLKKYVEYSRPIKQVLNHIHQRFAVEFKTLQTLEQQEVTFDMINQSIINYLFILIDMHMHAKAKIKSPQSKLIDFINRVKLNYQFNDDRGMPYSFQGLMLLIGKDRKKIYDRYIGNQFIQQPQFLLEYITRQSKKSSKDLYTQSSSLYEEQMNYAMKGHFDQNYSHKKKTKRLIQGYLFYMMEFQRLIQKICGKDSFVPQNFVNQEHNQYNSYMKNILSSKDNKQWLQQEVKAVLQQLLQQRGQVQKKLTKGELYLYDQDLSKKLEPQSIRELIRQKLTQEIFVVKNIFTDQRQYDYNPSFLEQQDINYTQVKRAVKSPDALKKFNNLNMSQQVFQEYIHNLRTTTKKEDLKMDPLLQAFTSSEAFFFKDGLTTRLPFKSYHRMARDIFVYPQDGVSVPSTPQEIDCFKKINMKFQRSLAGQRIHLSNFSKEYRDLKTSLKSQLLDEMLQKIDKVESL